jgi:hypothetical protein
MEAFTIATTLIANGMNYQSTDNGMIAWCPISDHCTSYVNYQSKLIKQLKALQNDLCEPLFSKNIKFKIINRYYLDGKSYSPIIQLIVS